MPTYDYRCLDCGTEREIFQKMSEEALTECPECGGAFKRVIRSVGIIFKGSGFHINDYRGKSGGASDKSASDKSTEKKSEKPSTEKDASSPSKSDGGTQDKVA